MNFLLFYFIHRAFSLITNLTVSNWENFTGLPVTDIIDHNSNHDIPLIQADPTFFQRTPPLIIFCFTSWCPHCKKARPGWEKFQEEVIEDNTFIAASLNCSSDPDLCEYLKIQSLPTFLTYFHGDIREIKGYHDSKTYEKIGKKLSLIHQSKYIKRYDTPNIKNEEYGEHTTFPSYPSFVFTFDFDSKSGKNKIESKLNSIENSEQYNDIEAMEIASKVIVASDSYQEEFFYLNSSKNSHQRFLRVFIDDDVSIELNGEFNFENILNFVQENCHQLFGDWSFSSLRSIKRKFAVYAGNDNRKKIDSDVKKFAIQNLNKFAWGSAKEFGEEQFNKIFKLKNSDFPAIVLIDIRRSRFAKLKKIKSEQEVVDFFNTIENYQSDEIEPKNGLSLFEPLEINNDVDDLLDLINSFCTLFVTLLAVCLSVSAIGFLIYCFYCKKPAPKYD